MNPSTMEIASIHALIEGASQLAATGDRWLFRGQSDADWPLQSRVHREYSAAQERFLTQEFCARAGVRHAHRPRYDDYPDWLALMQHYGLPTRLLDWSHSPLTAAFFATQRTMRHSRPRSVEHQPAAIWALAPARLNVAQGLEPFLYPLNSHELRRLIREAFYSREIDARVAGAMAIETDVRMQVQRGAFTVHGIPTPLDQWDGNENWLRKFVIPSSAVAAVGRDVDALGVGLADLFPDLASLAQELAGQMLAAT